MKTKISIALALVALLFTACSTGSKEDLKNFFDKAADAMSSLARDMANVTTADDAVAVFKKAGSKMADLRKEQRPLQRRWTRSEIQENKKLNDAYQRWRSAGSSLTAAALALKNRYQDNADVEKAYRKYQEDRSRRTSDGRTRTRRRRTY